MRIPTAAERPQGVLTRSYSTASSRGPEVSLSETAERVGLRLDVYSPSQVLQTNGCFYHSPLPPWV